MLEVRARSSSSSPDQWQPVVVVSTSVMYHTSSFGADWRRNISSRKSSLNHVAAAALDPDAAAVQSDSRAELSRAEFTMLCFPPDKGSEGYVQPVSPSPFICIHAGKILDRYRSCWISHEDLKEGNLRRMTLWTPSINIGGAGGEGEGGAGGQREEVSKHLMSGKWSIYDRDAVLGDLASKALTNLKREKLKRKVALADGVELKGGRGKNGLINLREGSRGLAVLARQLARNPYKSAVNR